MEQPTISFDDMNPDERAAYLWHEDHYAELWQRDLTPEEDEWLKREAVQLACGKPPGYLVNYFIVNNNQ